MVHTVDLTVLLVLAVTAVHSFTLLVTGLRERGLLEGERSSLHLRIFSYPGRNRRIRAKKPATESTSAQGATECLNPSRSDVRPPLRLEAAF